MSARVASPKLNAVALPQEMCIRDSIYGTDVTFGFHTAVDIATEVIDRIHTTAGSHSRVMCIEIMGNKAGWLTLYSGIAGGADIILLPELPYDIKKVAAAVENRAKAGKNFSILAVAEGAFSVEEAKMKRKEWTAKRAEAGYTTATARIAKQVEELTGAETRICVPVSYTHLFSHAPTVFFQNPFNSYIYKEVSPPWLLSKCRSFPAV